MQHCVTADISGNQVKSGQIVVFLVESGPCVLLPGAALVAKRTAANSMKMAT